MTSFLILTIHQENTSVKLIDTVSLAGSLALLASAAYSQDCPEGKICAYVRQDVPAGGDTYSSINAALQSSTNTYSRIVVYPGVYTENIVVTRSVTIESLEGPLVTCIDGSGDANASAISTSSINADLSLIGFQIGGARYGIEVGASTTASIRNCVVESNSLAGIYIVGSGDSTPSTEVVAINNTILNTSQGPGVDVLLSPGSGSTGTNLYAHITPLVTFRGNIITDNRGSGFVIRSPLGDANNTSGGPRDTSRLRFDENLLRGNTPGNFGGYMGTSLGLSGVYYVPGGGTLLDATVNFRESYNTCGTDVRLGPNSAARDTGPAGGTFADPDGTRNDMGAFGGPYAARFFQSVTDGPIVRDIVAPSSVRHGETITIEATGAVR